MVLHCGEAVCVLEGTHDFWGNVVLIVLAEGFQSVLQRQKSIHLSFAVLIVAATCFMVFSIRLCAARASFAAVRIPHLIIILNTFCYPQTVHFIFQPFVRSDRSFKFLPSLNRC